MPTKTASKPKTDAKSDAKSSGVEVALAFTKATKNTFRFDAADDDAAITSLYVRKEAFGGQQPTSVTLTVTPA